MLKEFYGDFIKDLQPELSSLPGIRLVPWGAEEDSTESVNSVLQHIREIEQLVND